MGIYIKGFKPKDGLYQIKDGVIRKYKEKGGTVRPYELVEVKEPHGRLGDLDYLYDKFRANGCPDSLVYMLIKEEPTVIEGSE